MFKKIKTLINKQNPEQAMSKLTSLSYTSKSKVIVLIISHHQKKILPSCIKHLSLPSFNGNSSFEIIHQKGYYEEIPNMNFH